MWRVLFIISVGYIVLYAFFSVLQYYGQIRRSMMILPLQSVGNKDDDLGQAVAASLARRLDQVRLIFDHETEANIAALFSHDVDLAGVVNPTPIHHLPAATIPLTISPLSLGPISLPVNQLIFSIINVRAVPVSGTIESYGDQLDIHLTTSHPERRAFRASVSTKEDLHTAIESLADQIAAELWLGAPGVSPAAFKFFRHALENIGEFVRARQPESLEQGRLLLKQAVEAAPDWDLPKLYVGRFEIWAGNRALEEGDDSRRQHYEAAMQNFRDAAFRAATRERKMLARVGELHAIRGMLRIRSLPCVEFVSLYDELKSLEATISTYLRDSGSAWERRSVLGLRRALLKSVLQRAQITEGEVPHPCVTKLGSEAERLSLTRELLAEAEKHIERIPRELKERPEVRRDVAAIHGFRGTSLIDRDPEAAYAEIRKSVEMRSDLVGQLYEPYARGSIAHDYLRLAYLEEFVGTTPDADERRRGYLHRAREQLEQMVREERGGPQLWAVLRLAEIGFILGDWRTGLRRVVEALALQAQIGVTARAAGKDTLEIERCLSGWEVGVLLVERDCRYALVEGLQELVQERHRDRHGVGVLLLIAEIAPDPSTARKALDLARERSSHFRFWLGSKLPDKHHVLQVLTRLREGDTGIDMQQLLGMVRRYKETEEIDNVDMLANIYRVVSLVDAEAATEGVKQLSDERAREWVAALIEKYDAGTPIKREGDRR